MKFTHLTEKIRTLPNLTVSKFVSSNNSLENYKLLYGNSVVCSFDFTNYLSTHSVGTLVITFVTTALAFCLVDMFDTMGTVLGCCTTANLLDKNGTPINYDKIMLSDSTATVAGSMFGTSTVSTFIESSTGVVAGGKTGLTAFTTAILFLLSIFLLPLFSFVPTAAASSALLYVGVLMMRSVKDIDFTTPKYAIPSFMTIVITVLGYSITKGIGLGIITFFVLDIIIYLIDKLLGKEAKLESTVVTIVIVVLYLIYFLVPLV